MIRLTTCAGKTIAVFGLARSGLATAEALRAGGADVVCWDDKAESRDAAAAKGWRLRDFRAEGWGGIASLVVSPGVPLTHPTPHWTVAAAKASSVEVIGDVELFFRQRAADAPGSPVIAITGTNGKSTTTALTAHLLKVAGFDIAMGGNIGIGVLSLAAPAMNRVHVLELSSYQIDLTPSLTPTVGILLNLSPDHLDRHGTMENYAAVKARLVGGADRKIIGYDDEHCQDIADRLRMMDQGWVDLISVKGRVSSGWFVDESVLHSRAPWAGMFGGYADMRRASTLRGAHNHQNALAASIAALITGAELKAVQTGLLSFPGLAHRMEHVGRAGKVLYVNDSKATNADSTDKALASYPGDIYWILGGESKAGGITPLVDHFGKVRKAYLIGAATDEFAATLDGKVPYERCTTMDVATARASADARVRAITIDCTEAIVLLSPACASFDQYKSFEHRGDHFRDLVTALSGVDRG